MVDHRGKQVLHVGAESRSVQSNVTAENAAAELAESGNERADAHAAQGQVGLTGLTAQAFYRGGGVMADAVDRKARDIRTADETWEQTGPILDAAVVVQQLDRGPVGEGAQPLHLAGPPADIEQASDAR